MVWLFVTIAVVGVFVVAAVTVGREAFRLGHQPPPTIFDLDEAVAYVADDLPDEAQARLSYDEVRHLVLAELDHLRGKGVLGLLDEDPEVAQAGRPGSESESGSGPVEGNGLPVVVADDDAVAVVLGRAEEEGLEVTDDDVFRVVASLHRYLADIGAVGPTA